MSGSGDEQNFRTSDMTPSRTTNASVSSKSRSDYSIYTLKSDQTVVVAVLIEAKLTTHSKFEHALGQVRF